MKVAMIIEADGKKVTCPSAAAQMAYFEKLLIENGIEKADKPEEMDYLIYSSCGFDGKTLERVCDKIKAFTWLQGFNGTHYKLMIVGCLAKMLKDVGKYNEDVIIVDDPVWSKAAIDIILKREKNILTRDILESKTKTYWYGNDVLLAVNIVDGCINKCSFCKHNYMGSNLSSIPYNDLLNYLKNKIKTGTKVIDFHGDCLNLYGIDLEGKPILHKLLHELAQEKDLAFMSLAEVTAQNMYPELLDEIRNNPKIRRVTLQLESASNEVLKNMNRCHTIERYDDIATTIQNGGKFIDTVLMTGFPKETYKDLDYTLDYIEKRGIPVLQICQYVDSNLVPSHNFEQFTYKEKVEHTKYVRDRLKDINLKIYRDNIWRMSNAVVYGKKEDRVFTVGGLAKFAYSDKEKHVNLELGSVIEEAPKKYIKKSRVAKGKTIYRY